MVAAVNVGYQILNQLLKDKVSARNPPSSPQPASDQALPKSKESEWVISINEKLQKANEDDAAVASSWDKLSIYKIPRYIRDGGNDKAFAPQIVSLGPYHHQKRHLRQMERHKWRSLNHVLNRTKQDIKLYLDSMKKIEEKARECYEGPIRTMSSTEFVEMLVLDGCFVLEILRGVTEKEGFEKLGYSNNDPVFSMNRWIHSIRNDMMMLENQLPLFVLQRLLRLQLGKGKLNNYFKKRATVVQLVTAFFEPLAPASEPGYPFDPLLSNQDGLHFLDVLRKNLLQRGARSGGLIRSRVAHKRRQQLIHCVTELLVGLPKQ
ncbi:hypothetical protein PIB30_081739, partial [Stylosanthes scabra]|nr:hypothetical protein [Stylosanthes scabra]